MSKAIGDRTSHNRSGNRAFGDVLEAHVTRRAVVDGGLALAIGALFGAGTASAAQSRPVAAGGTGGAPTLGFPSVANSMTDGCVVPEGYSAKLLAPWGTPLHAGVKPWDATGANTAADQAGATGMHHDGMHYFPLSARSNEGLLVLNHEYIDQDALHPHGPTLADKRRPAEEVRKEINAHGLSVVHVRRTRGAWEVVGQSRYNRRITSATPLALGGPIAGSKWTRTPFSPEGLHARGTNNNCGNGHTPWGTYIAAEENWATIFANRVSEDQRPADQVRLGVTATSRYQWETAAGAADERAGEFSRFDITPVGASGLDDWRNEIHTFGYLVELDPYDPTSVPVKRTAMGRFAHEGSAYSPPVAGQPLSFYSGDDSRFEYLYRFVSDALWDPADARRKDRLAVGDKYLNRGTLYAARFDEDGRGEWLALSPETRGKDGRTLGEAFGTLSDILIHTRGAADFVGATPMDRPEWTAVHPINGDAYVSLTNNTQRSQTNAANPRANNANGHIVRWHDEPGSTRFKWELFVYGADAGADADINRSGLTGENQFASPDGLSFDDRGILWIQTDNGIDGGRKNAVARSINDQMLAFVPPPMTLSRR